MLAASKLLMCWKELFQKKPPRFYLALGIVFFCGILFGWITGQNAPDRTFRKPAGEIVRQSQTGLIHPILDYEIDFEFNETKLFRSRLQKFITQQIDNGKARRVSVYFRDLVAGAWFGINEKDTYFLASLKKVPIMILTLKQAESDTGTLE
ncbi:MAG: serine hydrolase, partial [bacterium]